MKYDLSIGIPTFNRANCIERAIDSALNQESINVEVIVSDNCSSDDTSNVLKKYRSNARVKYLRNSFNLGPVSNYNRCLEKASGLYFMILGDDDWLSANYGHVLIQTLKGEDDVFVGKCTALTPAGTIVHESLDSPFQLTGKDAYFQIIGRSPMVARHAWFMLAAKTSTLRKCGGFPNTEAGQHSDNMLLLKLLLQRRICYDPRAVNFYSVYPGSYGNRNVSSVAIAALQFVEFWDHQISPELKRLVSSREITRLRGKLIQSLSLLYLGRVYRYGGTVLAMLKLLLFFPRITWVMRALFSRMLAVAILKRLRII